MQKNNVGSLVLIVVSVVLMFSWSFIADLFGGMSRPYVPSIVGILILLSAVLLYLGIRKSTIDFRGNIPVVLIFFFSGILGPTYLRAVSGNIFFHILGVVCIVSFILCFAYIISQIADLSFKDKVQVIGDNSKLYCLVFVVIFIVCVACGNMSIDSDVTTIGHVELDKAKVSIANGGKEHVGHWEQVGTGTNLGEVYDQKSPVVNQSIKFNLKNIGWEGQVDDAKLKQALKTDENATLENHKVIVKLYDSDGNYINKYGSVAKFKGQEFIINGSSAFDFDKQEMSNTDVKYVEVELILEDDSYSKSDPDYYQFYIISDRFEIK